MIKNLHELQQLCQRMQGLTIENIAAKLQKNIPNSLVHAKGWVGNLVESYLGACGGNNKIQDFPCLGIELKTIPINIINDPLESTYVCTVQSNESNLIWRNSWVYKKMQKVLWVPIRSDLPIAKRIIHKPILWNMDVKNETILRSDWEELMEMMQIGFAKNISSKFGQYLHMRPKAANSNILINYTDENGIVTKIIPKGFYLRKNFTKQIIKTSFL